MIVLLLFTVRNNLPLCFDYSNFDWCNIRSNKQRAVDEVMAVMIVMPLIIMIAREDVIVMMIRRKDHARYLYVYHLISIKVCSHS